jgi:hypothetical protein
MDPQDNPFAALSFIVAPAVLTNASSVLALSTSNRLARAVDRARALTTELEATRSRRSHGTQLDLKELAGTQQRTLEDRKTAPRRHRGRNTDVHSVPPFARYR